MVGAGIAGLGAAIGLARRGIRALVLDKDPPAPAPARDREAVFDQWDRRSVPQAKQPHTFQAQVTNELRTLAPDVLDRLVESGIQTTGFGLDLLPPEQRSPEDDALRSLLCRRLPFELELRKTAEAEPLVTIRPSSAVVAARRGDEDVTAVILADGTVVETDWLIDAGGRRSPIARALTEAGAPEPRERTQRCSYNYFTRHFRRRPEFRTAPLWTILAVRNDLGHLVCLGFPADDETFAVLLGAPSDIHPELRALRHVDAWDAVAQRLPRLPEWTSPDVAEPLTDVLVMAGQQNMVRDFCNEDGPVAPGWLPVGDALCTTNPGLALGASLALTHAGAAVDAIASGADRTEAVLAYHDAVFAEAEAWYHVAADADRVRDRLLRGTPLDDDDIAVLEQEILLRFGVGGAGNAGDVELMRALMRRLHLVDGPHDWLHTSDIADRGRAFLAANPPNPKGPTLPELLELVR